MASGTDLGVSPERLAALREAALSAYVRHYARYSKFVAVAAVETKQGIFSGANVEIANYTLTKHAEEVAIIAAILGGAGPKGKWIQTLYVCGGPPCGSCRQFMSEFAGADAIVLVDRATPASLRRASPSSLTARPVEEFRLGDLYPEPFTGEHVDKAGERKRHPGRRSESKNR